MIDMVDLTQLEGLDEAIAQSSDGLVYIQLLGGFLAAGDKLKKAILGYNRGNHEALDMYHPGRPQPTFEESSRLVSKSSAGTLVFDPKQDRIVRVLNQYDGTVILEITKGE